MSGKVSYDQTFSAAAEHVFSLIFLQGHSTFSLKHEAQIESSH